MHMRGKTICEFTVIIEYPGFEADLGFELNLGSLEPRESSDGMVTHRSCMHRAVQSLAATSDSTGSGQQLYELVLRVPETYLYRYCTCTAVAS